MGEVAVPCRRSRELGPAVGADGLGGLARLFALVSKQVAEGGKLAPVAAVLPALRLRPALHHPDVVRIMTVPAARGQQRRSRVHHPRVRHRGLPAGTARALATARNVHWCSNSPLYSLVMWPQVLVGRWRRRESPRILNTHVAVC